MCVTIITGQTKIEKPGQGYLLLCRLASLCCRVNMCGYQCPPFPFVTFVDDGWYPTRAPQEPLFSKTFKAFSHIFHVQATLQPAPRILTFADIISEAEIAALLAAQNEGAFHQSKDQGDYDSFGISEVGLFLRLLVHSVSALESFVFLHNFFQRCARSAFIGGHCFFQQNFTDCLVPRHLQGHPNLHSSHQQILDSNSKAILFSLHHSFA